MFSVFINAKDLRVGMGMEWGNLRGIHNLYLIFHTSKAGNGQAEGKANPMQQQLNDLIIQWPIQNEILISPSKMVISKNFNGIKMQCRW